jgi:multidrug resistance efflux pump
MQYQVLPAASLVLCASLAAWLWASQSRSAAASGEVQAIRVNLQSYFDGVLEEIPKPVKLFDRVSAGQVVARMDTSAAEGELRRLEQELSQDSAGASTTWQQTRIDELRARISRKEIKSPIDGTVTAIQRRPGEGALIGQPVMTIASTQSELIIGYLREDRMVRPAPGMTVIIQSRTKPTRKYRSYIVTAGAQVEALPYRHWRNPQVMEWGWPIQAAMPPEAELAPGELVDLIIKPATK